MGHMRYFFLILAVAMTVTVVGCGEFKKGFKEGFERQKGAQCPFCKEHFPHGDIMGHKLTCPKNDTDMEFKK